MWLSRRSVLGAAGAGFGVGGAGCLTTGTSRAEGSELGHFFVENRHDEPHTVVLKLTWDGDVVLNESYQLAAADPDLPGSKGAVPEQTWPSESGQFTLAARLSGGAWRRADPADHGYPACFSAAVEVRPSGLLTIWQTSNPNECDPDTMQRGTPSEQVPGLRADSR